MKGGSFYDFNVVLYLKETNVAEAQQTEEGDYSLLTSILLLFPGNSFNNDIKILFRRLFVEAP